METGANLAIDFDSVRPTSWWRARARGLYIFCRGILSNSTDEMFHDWGVLHEMLCDFLDPVITPGLRKFISVFRGSYKTTCLLGYCLFLFLWACDERRSISICYNTSTKENAQAFMENFRQQLAENKLLHAIFPWLPKDATGYRRNTQWKVELFNAKFHVTSLDTKLASRHYTVFINDDLVNEDNAFSEKERTSVLRKWRLQKSVLTRYSKRKVGTEIDVGTPYHPHDLITRIIKKSKTYDKFIIPYRIKNSLGEWMLSFPEMYAWEDFDAIREDQGSTIFSTQYELKVIEDSDRLAEEGWLKYWRYLPDVRNRYLLVDPAGTENRDNDPVGYLVCDVDVLGNIYIIYAAQFWHTPWKMLRFTKNLQDQFRPDDTFMEREKYSIYAADTVDKLLPGLIFSLVSHDNAPPDKRIHPLKQYFETGRIFLGQGMKDLEDQITGYPDIRHNHILMCLAYVLKVMDIPTVKFHGAEEPETELEKDFIDDIKKMREKYSQKEDYDASF